MTRDPSHIAEAIRSFRSLVGWTQENLADFSNLSVRTIQKAESGRHCPDENTLRRIAKAFKTDLSIFTPPSPGELERIQREAEHLRRRSVMVRTVPVRTSSDVLGIVTAWHMLRTDMTAVTDDQALGAAAELIDYVTDLMDLWSDLSMSDQVRCATEIAQLSSALDEKGYTCQIGSHRQRQRIESKPDLVFNVGLVTVRPRTDQPRYTLVVLDHPWEPLPEDQNPPLPQTTGMESADVPAEADAYTSGAPVGEGAGGQ